MVACIILLGIVFLVSGGIFLLLFLQEKKLHKRTAQELESYKILTEKLKTENRTSLEYMAHIQEHLSEKFESFSKDAILRSQKSFFEMANETFSQYHAMISGSVATKHQEIATTIAPLKSSLELIDKKVHELELARKGAYDAIVQQLTQVSATQTLLQKETSSLHKVLRDPTVRGRWGEVQLRRVVELAGMLPYCDFDEQVHHESDGNILRPDMIVHLPKDRHVVLDAKVSLSAYLDAVSSENIEEKEAKLLLHSRQVRQHVIKLSQKKYWEQFEKTPDFVILFLHGDCYLAPALEYDKELLEFASAHKVLIATPTSLIAMLKVIASSWREATIEQHAQEILQEAQVWIERSKVFMEHFTDIGRHLDRTVKAYDKAVSSYENRLHVSVRRLASCGLCVEQMPEVVQLGATPICFSLEKEDS